MLEKLGFKKRTHVGISLSANNFIELVCIDKVTKTVVKYSSGNIKYNNAIREILDFEEFTEVLEGLFEDAGLTPSECCVTLNIPNVHFGITTLESAADTPYIIENLQSEIEDLYIFKRNEPVISYSVLDVISYSVADKEKSRIPKKIIFGAVQAKIIGKIVEIFDSLDIELVRIDTAYSSMLKAIKFCDRFSKHTQAGESTSILLITPNSCCTFYLNGDMLIDYTEEPLAVKSFSTDEVYAAISRIAEGAITKHNPKSFLIISETDEVDSGFLSQRLDYQGEIDYINKSINTNEQFIDISGIGSNIDANMISYLTIEAVGAACADYDEYPLNINFMPSDRVDNNVVEFFGWEINFIKLIINLFATAAILAGIIGLLGYIVIDSQYKREEDKSSKMKGQIEVFSKKIQEGKEASKRNIYPVLSKIITKNKEVISVYSALSTEIPESIYIKKFVTNPDGGIGILGEATSSESVKEFVTNLREKNPNLTLSRLALNSSADIISPEIPNGFTFEIKTTGINVLLDPTEDLLDLIPESSSPSNVSNPYGGGGTSTTRTKVTGKGRSRVAPPPSPII